MNARLRPCAEISRRTRTSAAIRRLEDRLNRGRILAGPHEVGRRTAPGQEADRLDDDRFACSGLAGQDVQAGLELDVEGVDDGQAADAEEPEHGGELQFYQMFDSDLVACYAVAFALSQRRSGPVCRRHDCARSEATPLPWRRAPDCHHRLT